MNPYADDYTYEYEPHPQRPRNPQLHPSIPTYNAAPVSYPIQPDTAVFPHVMAPTDSVATGYGDFRSLPDPRHVTHHGPPTEMSTAAAQASAARLDSGEDSDGSADVEEVDTSKMTKDELRKYKNRLSASRSRQRTRKRMEALQTMARDLSNQNQYLEEQRHALLLERASRMNANQYPPTYPPSGYPPQYYGGA